MQVVEADNATYLETTSGQSVRIIRKNLLPGRVTVHVMNEVSIALAHFHEGLDKGRVVLLSGALVLHGSL